jgi:hypothetical protein
MVRKANLGKDATKAVRLASALNRRFAIETERQAERLDAAIDVGAPSFGSAFEAFVEKYSNDYRLKPSTHKLLLQRRDRLSSRIGDHVVGERVISRIRKTDSDARDIEATSVSFRMHPDVHRIIAATRANRQLQPMTRHS